MGTLNDWHALEIAANKAGFGSYTDTAHENAATKVDHIEDPVYVNAAYSTLSMILCNAPEAAQRFFAKYGIFA